MTEMCIFDLDGTVVNTIESISYFVNETFDAFELPGVPDSKVREFVGKGARTLIKRCLIYVGADTARLDRVLATYKRTYHEKPAYLTKSYDGLREILDSVKAQGCKIAVLSNKPHRTAVALVNTLFGEGYFDVCMGQREGASLKPDPTVLLEMIKDVNKGNCLYIGDTSVDVQTANNAGIKFVGAAWGFGGTDELEAAGAQFIAHSPNEILNFIIK